MRNPKSARKNSTSLMTSLGASRMYDLNMCKLLVLDRYIKYQVFYVHRNNCNISRDGG